MNTKTILLGGAMAMALWGAGYAQQPATNASTNANTQTNAATHAKAIHHRHRHATMHARATRTERQATRNLNLQQERMAQYGAQYPQGAYAQGPYGQAYAQGYAQGVQSAQYGYGSYGQSRTMSPAEYGSPGMQSGGGYPQAPAYGPNGYRVQTAWGTPTDVTAYGPNMTAGPNSGYTPVRRLPNGNPFGTATAGGGMSRYTSGNETHIFHN
jgi:hypothetical protein